MKRALQYLWRTNDVGFTSGGTLESCTKLSACVDADFALRPGRHSAFGFGRSGDAGGGSISLFSRVQKMTAAASSESEYVSLAEYINELRLLRQVEGFLTPPIDGNVVIREYN